MYISTYIYIYTVYCIQPQQKQILKPNTWKVCKTLVLFSESVSTVGGEPVSKLSFRDCQWWSNAAQARRDLMGRFCFVASFADSIQGGK